VPSWLVLILVNFGVGLVNRYGIPFVEKNWPFLVPLIEEIVAVIKGIKPSENLKKVSDHYNELCSGVCPPSLKKT